MKKHPGGKPSTNLAHRQKSIRAISDAAIALFCRKGYDATTIDDIATASKLTKGGVYFYIRKKETLLLSLIDEASESYFDGAYAAMSAVPRSPRGKLVALIDWQIAFAISTPKTSLFLVMTSIALHGQHTKPALRVAAAYNYFRHTIADVIDEGKRLGEFTTSLPTRDLAALFLAIHDGTVLQWARQSDEIDRPNLLAALRASLVAALRI
jgi:AcrR family transcriptional regulator